MTFQELNLIEPLKRAVAEKGYTTPTPIQQQAIPPALEGRDLMGCAQTGTGKTAAFTLPILQLLSARPRTKGRRPIKALVLTPTRELAIQIDECCRDYARYTDLRHCVIFGGVNQRPQVDALQRGIDLLVATPGRLLDLIGQGYVSLSDIRFFVLDEADRMLDMGFIHDIKRILPLLPKERQTLFFSATMPSDIVTLANSMLHDPVHVTVTPPASVVETISQSVMFAEKAEKKDLLISLLRERSEGSVLVFSRTKHGADRIARILTKAGIEGRAIHGDKSQNQRRAGDRHQRTAAGHQLRPAGSGRNLCTPHRTHGTRRARRHGDRILLGRRTPAAERHPETDRTCPRSRFRTPHAGHADRHEIPAETGILQAGRTEAGRTGRRRPDAGRTKRRCKRAAPTQAKRPETGRTSPERTRAATAKRRRTSVRKPRTGPPQAAPPQTQRPEIRRAAFLKRKVSQQREIIPEKGKRPGAGKRPRKGNAENRNRAGQPARHVIRRSAPKATLRGSEIQ